MLRLREISYRVCRFTQYNSFLQRAAKLALQALYMYMLYGISVCLSVRHTPVLCQNEGTQRDAVFTVT